MTTLRDQILQARDRYLHAEEACPHWDYEGEGSEDHPCCLEMRASASELSRLKRARNDAERVLEGS